jgi:hypothetical protein
MEDFFDVEHRPDFERAPAVVPAKDVSGVPLPIMLRELVEPGPDPLRRNVDADGVAQSNHEGYKKSS